MSRFRNKIDISLDAGLAATQNMQALGERHRRRLSTPDTNTSTSMRRWSCKLTLRDIVVYCPADDSCCFVLAAQMRGKLYHEIYCYPSQNLRERWLDFFRHQTWFLGKITLSDISEESEMV